MRNVASFVEKIASSTVARSPVSEFSRRTCRCCSPELDASLCAETIVQPASADPAARKKMIAALSFRTVLIDQSLEARIFSQRVPDRIEFQEGYANSGR